MTKADIYDQHRAAFSNVSAYVITRDNKRVATVAIRFPKDGASKLWVYVHWFGVPMVRGSAGGYGYDKVTAACASAVVNMQRNSGSLDDLNAYDAFRACLLVDGGDYWDAMLRKAGFEVWQAV